MQTDSPRPQGLLARFQARLRGDRYMVDAYPKAPADPEPVAAPPATAPKPEPVAVPPATAPEPPTAVGR